MTRFIKRGGKVWLRVFPTSRSQRSLRKSEWAPVRALWITGLLLYAQAAAVEMEGVTPEIAREAMRLHRTSCPGRRRLCRARMLKAR